MQGRPTVAIVNAHWPVHSSVGYMAASLEKAGYDVDVFLHCSDESLCGDFVAEAAAVRVHRFGSTPTELSGSDSVRKVNSTGKLRGVVKALLPPGLRRQIREIQEYLLLQSAPAFGLIPHKAVRSVVEVCRHKLYVALIGVEKGGLGLAGAVSQQTGIPLVYYSLELYDWDHHWVKASTRMKRFKRIEERYHRQCAATIVQDVHRGRALLASNHISDDMRTAYLPISLVGSPNTASSQWLQKELNLDAGKILILSYGMMHEQRLCIELARVAQAFPEDWRLVFHGYGSPAVINSMRNTDVLHRLCISQKLVPASQREEIVRSAKIGLAIYASQPLNDRLTGLSSEKIALYFKCGLPLIAFRHPSYEHVEAEGAGVLVERLEDIPMALRAILDDYPSYTERAYNCFLKHYQFESNFTNVLEVLRQISQRKVKLIPT